MDGPLMDGGSAKFENTIHILISPNSWKGNSLSVYFVSSVFFFILFLICSNWIESNPNDILPQMFHFSLTLTVSIHVWEASIKIPHRPYVFTSMASHWIDFHSLCTTVYIQETHIVSKHCQCFGRIFELWLIVIHISKNQIHLGLFITHTLSLNRNAIKCDRNKPSIFIQKSHWILHKLYIKPTIFAN